MRRVAATVAVITALLAVAALAFTWLNSLINSIYGYSSPLKGEPPLEEYIHQPLTSQVVLLIVDGLRYDTSLRMPNLNSLRRRGAEARMSTLAPSTTLPSWTTLVSGAGPEINGAPLLDRDYRWITPLTVDNLFASVSRVGARAGIAGFYWWEKLVPPADLYTRYFVSTEGEATDQDVVTRACRFVTEFQPNFLLVQLRQLELVGQHHGAISPEYERAVLSCDRQIQLVASSMDLDHSVLIVVSSYGQLDKGGHGADEPITLSTPFVMVGESIRTGKYKEIAATDVAPTIAALLGIPVPSAAQGQMRVDMLRMSAVDKADKLVSLASQRVHLGNVYLGSIGRGSVSDTAEGDMLVALSSLQVRNYDSASELASLAVQQTDREMQEARHSRIWGETVRRAAPIALLGFIVLSIIWHNRSWTTLWSLLAGLLCAALYHALLLHEGNLYSFSHIPPGGLATLFRPSVSRAAVCLALGGTVVAWRACRDRQQSVFAIVLRSYGYGASALLWIGLLLAGATLSNGPRFSWYLPSFALAYVQFVALMQAMAVAILSIALPLIILPLQRGLTVLTRQMLSVGTTSKESYAYRDHR